MKAPDRQTAQNATRSRRKLLKDAAAIAASATIATVFADGCKSAPVDQKESINSQIQSPVSPNDALAALAKNLNIPVSLLKQHRGFLVFWLMLTTNPNWLDPHACQFPDAAQIEADLGGDLKKEQIDAVFKQIQGSDNMRKILYNAGAIFNDSQTVKDSSGFSYAGYSDRTCPPGLEIILSLYQPKATFNTNNPNCSNTPAPNQIKLQKVISEKI